MKKILKYSVFLLLVLLGFTFYFNIFYTIKTAYATTSKQIEPKNLAEVQKTPIDELIKFQKYDGRKLGTVTEVLDQGGTGLCWAFSSMSTIQSNLLRKGVVKNANDFPWMIEGNIGYTMYNRLKGDPLHNTDETTFSTPREVWMNKGGFPQELPSLFSQGRGISDYSSQSDEFDNCYDFMSGIAVENTVESIKRAVAEYGGVAFSYTAQMGDEIYVYDKTSSYNHACEIVGWDDTISKDKFLSKYLPDKTKPKHDGAWICKNSWGITAANPATGAMEPVGDKGYFYLSYDSLISNPVTYDFEAPTEYDNIYFYDAQTRRMEDGVSFRAGVSGNNTVKAANIYEAKAGTRTTKEMLKSVNVGVFGKDVECTVKVYTGLNSLTATPESGTLKSTKTAKFKTTGFYTITLDNLIELQNREFFSIVIEVTNPDNTATILCDMDYASTYDFSQYWDANLNIWRDAKAASYYTARIKGFTINQVRDNPITNDINYATISNLPDSVFYNEKAQEPNFVLNMDNVNLILDQDYTVSYTDNIKVGTASLIIQGKGKYTGTLCKTFMIKKATTPPNLPGVKEDVYGSTKRCLEINYPVQKFGDIQLPENWKWVFPESQVVTGVNKINHIQYTDPTGYADGYERTMFDVIVTQRAENNNNGSGTDNGNGNIKPTTIDIQNCTVHIIGEYIYTGSAIQPKIEVWYQNNKLMENVDYSYSNSNNINAGSYANITVIGRGNYTGNKTVNFTIQQAERPITENLQIEIPKTATSLKDIALPKDWKWKDPNILLSNLTLSRQIVKATIVYVGVDRANYKNTELEIELDLKSNTAIIPSYQTPNSTIQNNKTILTWIIVGSMLLLILAVGITVPIVLINKRKVVKK